MTSTERVTVKVEATLRRLRKALRRAALRTPDIDEALEAAELLGTLNWLNNDGLLSDEELERTLFERHKAALDERACALQPLGAEWLHVVSTTYFYGGHTRLLEMLLAAQGRMGHQTAVVVTRSTTESFEEMVRRNGTALHRTEGGHADRAAAVLALGRAANVTVLHIHPDDVGAALAARQLRVEGRKVLFVNHADHCFSYGPGAADVCLEISGFGWRLTEKQRAAHAQHFFGIPIEAHARATPKAAARAEPPQGPIFSMGSPEKYVPGRGLDFHGFVSDLLDRSDATVEIVGPAPEDPTWAETLARHGDRLRLLGRRPFAETEARLAQAAAYVDSFPMNGGTAFPQALMTGKTVFGLAGNAGGYSLADALCFPGVEAMTQALLTFLKTGEPLRGEAAIRRDIAKTFNADAIAARLDSAAAGELLPLPGPLRTHMSRNLDYHSRTWHAAGRVTFNLAAAGGLPFRDRLALALAALRRPAGLKGPGRRALPLWVLRGR